MTEFETHAAAEIFPPMEGPEFDALVADIAADGLREPITVIGGAVLDGRNRLRACERLGIAPTTVEWDGAGAPEAFVVSRNLHRRHLNETQRAMIATKLAALRKGHVGVQRLKNVEQSGGVEISTPLYTMEEAGKMLNVAHSTVTNAKTVLKEGTAAEIAAIDAGTAAVSTTARRIRAGGATSGDEARPSRGGISGMFSGALDGFH